MGENSKIEWCDHTFNPWTGCRAVSPACDHCYAEAWAKRCGRDFAKRTRTTAANWKKPLAWDAKAAAAGRRDKVFCASLADVFDAEVPDDWRDDLFVLIAITPHLDWLLLTKRPKVARDHLRGGWDRIIARVSDMAGGHTGAEALALELHHGITLRGHLPNLWLGVTVENQAMADARIPLLLDTPAAKRFVSCEPLLGPVDIGWALSSNPLDIAAGFLRRGNFAPGLETLRRLDWVIAGGESGPKARPSHPDWFRSLRDQCAAAGVAFMLKQLGEWGPSGVFPEAATHGIFPDGSCYEAASIMCPDLPGGRVVRQRHAGQPYAMIRRVGKARAGRLLDGREHLEVPEASHG